MPVALPTDHTYYFALSVSYQECELLYHPGNNTVVLTAESGHRVQVPALRLKPFIQRTGIKGRFRMITDRQHKIKSFERIA